MNPKGRRTTNLEAARPTRSREPATVGALLQTARRRLLRASFEPSVREAALLLGHVLGRCEAGILARVEEAVEDADRRRFEALLERRLRGEPVAYLVGEREFYGRPFAVDRRVLIPRPETEHLIEAALGLDLPASPRILDVGAGSGAIAVTLALELRNARVVATDISLDALEVARINRRRHRVGDRLSLLAADLLRPLRLERFDVVVSNPPYVDPGDAGALSPEVVEFEPHLALFAGDSGRALLTGLLDRARALRPGKALLLEIGYDQAEWLTSAAGARRYLELTKIVRDYAGIPRTAILRRLAHG